MHCSKTRVDASTMPIHEDCPNDHAICPLPLAARLACGCSVLQRLCRKSAINCEGGRKQTQRKLSHEYSLAASGGSDPEGSADRGSVPLRAMYWQSGGPYATKMFLRAMPDPQFGGSDCAFRRILMALRPPEGKGDCEERKLPATASRPSEASKTY